MNNLLESRFLTVIIIVLLILLIGGLGKTFYQKYTAQQQINELKQQAELLRDRNQNLAEQISKLQNPNYLEKVAKKRLNVSKEGEKVVVLVDEEGGQTEDKVTNKGWLYSSLTNIPYIKNNEEIKSNIVKWWKIFFEEKI